MNGVMIYRFKRSIFNKFDIKFNGYELIGYLSYIYGEY